MKKNLLLGLFCLGALSSVAAMQADEAAVLASPEYIALSQSPAFNNLVDYFSQQELDTLVYGILDSADAITNLKTSYEKGNFIEQTKATGVLVSWIPSWIRYMNQAKAMIAYGRKQIPGLIKAVPDNQSLTKTLNNINKKLGIIETNLNTLFEVRQINSIYDKALTIGKEAFKIINAIFYKEAVLNNLYYHAFAQDPRMAPTMEKLFGEKEPPEKNALQKIEELKSRPDSLFATILKSDKKKKK